MVHGPWPMAQSGGGASPRWSGLLLYNLTLVLSVVDALEALSFSQVFFSCSEGETHLLRNLLTSMVCTHGDEWELHPLEGRKTPPMQTLETPCHLTLHTPAVHARGFGGAGPIQTPAPAARRLEPRRAPPVPWGSSHLGPPAIHPHPCRNGAGQGLTWV